jgi:hypothetical protein
VASFIGFSLVRGQLLSWSTWQSSRQLHSTTSAVTITLEDRVSLFINPNLSNPLMESHSATIGFSDVLMDSLDISFL